MKFLIWGWLQQAGIAGGLEFEICRRSAALFFDKDKYQGPKLGFIYQAQIAE